VEEAIARLWRYAKIMKGLEFYIDGNLTWDKRRGIVPQLAGSRTGKPNQQRLLTIKDRILS
jgi:hypothetical protein